MYQQRIARRRRNAPDDALPVIHRLETRDNTNLIEHRLAGRPRLVEIPHEISNKRVISVITSLATIDE